MKEGGEGDSAGQGIERANFLAGRGGESVRVRRVCSFGYGIAGGYAR